jgi:hypothetical protein
LVDRRKEPDVAQSSALDRIKSVARTGFGVGRTVAGQAAKAATTGATKAAGAVSGYVASRRQSNAPTPSVPAPKTPPPPRSTPEPKAMTEPKAKAEPEPKPKTEPTPADVAKLVAKKPRPAAPATKAVKKPAKKSVPGAKLPPRKPAE